MKKHAAAFASRKDWQNAVATYRSAYATDKSDPDLFSGLCSSLYKDGRYADVITLAINDGAHFPATETMNCLLTDSYLQTGQAHNALRTANDALALFPGSGDLYYLVGMCHFQDNKPVPAIRAWIGGCNQKTGASKNLYALCKTYSQYGFLTDAIFCGECYLLQDTTDNDKITEIQQLIWQDFQILYGRHIKTDGLVNKHLPRLADPDDELLAGLLSLSSVVSDGVTPENLATVGIRFLLSSPQAAPGPVSRLLTWQRQLLADGWYDVYNESLFGNVADSAAHNVWMKFHCKEVATYTTWLAAHPLPQ
jgi:tetratricopeptide (TPR) repeat protein